MARETPRGQLLPTNPACGRLREHTARLALASVAVRSVARFPLRSRALGDGRSCFPGRGPGGPKSSQPPLPRPQGFQKARETRRGNPFPASSLCSRGRG